MKRTLSGILLILTLLFSLASCRKNYSNEHFTEEIPVIKPDFTQKVNITVSGFVTDENNDPLFNAEVTAGNKTTTTDEFGYFRLADVNIPKTAAVVKVSVTGYFHGYKTLLAEEGEEVFTRIQLIPLNNAGSINAASGGSATLPDGARLSLPASAVSVASSGAPYSGEVRIAARWIDGTGLQAAQLQMPGDGRGTNKDGNLHLLKFRSTMAVELTAPSGELLKIAAGKEATLTLPIAPAQQSTAPATITLWSFDEVNGIWKEEGTAQKNGSSYTGNVSHFSFWAGAEAVPLVEFTARIVNTSLQPVANAAVGIRAATEPFNAGYGRFGYTNDEGYVTGVIPANSQLLLNVLTPCETEAYTHGFSTTYSNTDLGTLSGNLGQAMVTISGNAVNCSNQPVTNGYVQLFNDGFINRIPVVNGIFSFTGVGCGNAPTNYIVVDNNSNQQSTPQSITLVTGNNNLGTLQACGLSRIGTISLTIDGVTHTFSEPADQLSGYGNLSGAWTAILKLNNEALNFQFDGGATLGSNHKVTDLFAEYFPGGRAIAPVPLTVNITEYGPRGGFIAGSFSGMMLDFPANGIHQVSCEFRVRRVQ